jgi:hypothetical protein
VNYTFPPPAEHKGYEVARLTKDYPGSVEMFIGKYAAWDTKRGRYILITGTQLTEMDPVIYDMYTCLLSSPTPNKTVTHLVVDDLSPQGKDRGLWSVQYDSIDDKFFALCDDGIWTIDIPTGNMTAVGPLTTQKGIIPTLVQDYDETSHQWFVSVTDDHDLKYLLTYNTRTGKSFITPNLNPVPLKHSWDFWYLYGIKYVPKTDHLIVFSDNYLGGPAIKTLDYRTGNSTDLIPEYVGVLPAWNDCLDATER